MILSALIDSDGQLSRITDLRFVCWKRSLMSSETHKAPHIHWSSSSFFVRSVELLLGRMLKEPSKLLNTIPHKILSNSLSWPINLCKVVCELRIASKNPMIFTHTYFYFILHYMLETFHSRRKLYRKVSPPFSTLFSFESYTKGTLFEKYYYFFGSQYNAFYRNAK